VVASVVVANIVVASLNAENATEEILEPEFKEAGVLELCTAKVLSKVCTPLELISGIVTEVDVASEKETGVEEAVTFEEASLLGVDVAEELVATFVTGATLGVEDASAEVETGADSTLGSGVVLDVAEEFIVCVWVGAEAELASETTADVSFEEDVFVVGVGASAGIGVEMSEETGAAAAVSASAFETNGHAKNRKSPAMITPEG
jgi:hypothetical protein